MGEGQGSGKDFSGWLRGSVSVKVVTIALLALVLLVPSMMVNEIVQERQRMSRETIQEVSREWAGEQTVKGPILTVPSGSREGGSRVNTQILPETLEVKGEVNPEKLHRGIYEVVVYSSDLTISGTFRPGDAFGDLDPEKQRWEEAFLTLGVSDMRGIEEQIEVRWNGEKARVKPGSTFPELVSSGVTIEISEIESSIAEEIPFTITLKMQGSRQLSFVPIGRTTNVSLVSPWNDPSFAGAFLPDSREVSESGFVAEWKVLEANRNFPPSWSGEEGGYLLDGSSFGVTMMSGVNDYQKSTRSVKYAILIIAFTFLVFFLVEITNGRRIHPFQYTLVGLALTLFYLLLVALSEHTGFNIAYGIAAAGVTAMIGLYSIPAFKSGKLSLLLMAVLVAVYTFLFVILQLEAYALLIGALGLAVVLASAMYFTRNIDWYRLGRRESEKGGDRSHVIEGECSCYSFVREACRTISTITLMKIITRFLLFVLPVFLLVSCGEDAVGNNEETPFTSFPVLLSPISLANQSAIKVMVDDGSGGWKDVTAEVSKIPCKEFFDEVGDEIGGGDDLALRFLTEDSVAYVQLSNPTVSLVQGTYTRDGGNYTMLFESIGFGALRLYGRAINGDFYVSMVAISRIVGDATSQLKESETLSIPSDMSDFQSLDQFQGDTVVYQTYEIKYQKP